MKYLTATLLAFLVHLCTGSKLPSSFKKCDKNSKDFNTCLTKAVVDAIQQLTKPIKEIGLPNMEPLEVPSLLIGAGRGPVAFEQKYHNLNVSGYSKIACSNIEMDLEAKILNLHCTFPETKMEFNYEIKGRILLLPIYGKGPGSIILEKVKTDVTFQLDEYEKKNKKYFKVSHGNLSLDPQRIVFKLDNLFDGDEALGKNINRVMNENWKEVFADVKPSYQHAFITIYVSIFNNFLSKVPIDDIFDSK